MQNAIAVNRDDTKADSHMFGFDKYFEGVFRLKKMGIEQESYQHLGLAKVHVDQQVICLSSKTRSSDSDS